MAAADLHREYVEAFIEHLLERPMPATANNRYRGLPQFFPPKPLPSGPSSEEHRDGDPGLPINVAIHVSHNGSHLAE